MRQYSIVIPTKDRQSDLQECIDSIIMQTAKPEEILVIDDGNLSENFRKEISGKLADKNINFRYFKKSKPGLAESKNLGAKEAKNEVVLFLDDDVVLEEEYAKNLFKVWDNNWNNKNLAGVSGTIKNGREKSFLEKIFNRIFFLSFKKTWSILPWGFQTWDYHSKKQEHADWTPGGTTSYRREIFLTYNFDAFQGGRTGLEDIEFGWKLKKEGYYFIFEPSARLFHKESPAGREPAFVSGYKEGVNRRKLFYVHADKNFRNSLFFCLAAFGWTLRQILWGNFSRGFGMAKGYLGKNKIWVLAAILILFSAILYFDKGLAFGLIFLSALLAGTCFALYKFKINGRRMFLLIFLVFLMRLAIALFMHYSNFQPFSGGSGDYLEYNKQAQEIARHIRRGDLLFRDVNLNYYTEDGLDVGHLFPVFMGYVYALVTPEMIVGQLFSVWLAVISAVAIYFISIEIGSSEESAFAAGLAGAIYPSYLFYCSLLLKDILVVPLVLIALLLGVKLIKQFKWFNFFIFYLALLSILRLRFYIGFAVLFAFVISWPLFSKMQFRKKILYFIFIFVVLGFAAQITGSGYYGIKEFNVFLNPDKVIFYREEAYINSPSSVEASASFDNPPKFIFGNINQGFNVLLGPFPWQLNSPRQFFVLLETLPWYFIFYFVVRGCIAALKNKIALFLVVFSLLVMGVLALFFGNFGIITRIRIPSFMALLCVATLGFKNFSYVRNNRNLQLNQ